MGGVFGIECLIGQRFKKSVNAWQPPTRRVNIRRRLCWKPAGGSWRPIAIRRYASLTSPSIDQLA